MGFLDKLRGKPEGDAEAAAEQLPKSTENNDAALEARESPEDQKKEVQATLAGALKKKVGMLESLAKLKIGGLTPRQSRVLVLSLVVGSRVLISVAGGLDIGTEHLGDLADAIKPEDLGHGHDHVVASVIPESDSGSHVVVEAPDPTPTPEPPPTKDYGTLDDFYGNKDETTNLVGENKFASASDAQVKKILDSMYEGSGETNYNPDGVPAPTTETPTPVPTETPAPNPNITTETSVPPTETVGTNPVPPGGAETNADINTGSNAQEGVQVGGDKPEVFDTSTGPKDTFVIKGGPYKPMGRPF